MFFFFKQKTAYEMRISDWSSDVCSSDLFLSVPWGAWVWTVCVGQLSNLVKSREIMRLISKMFNLNDPGWGRGNNNGSEPPRRPNKGDGTPDLDEVWRDFNNRLGSLFGRKPKRGGSPVGRGDHGSGSGGGAAHSPQGPSKLWDVINL